jgi:hypothetical protein
MTLKRGVEYTDQELITAEHRPGDQGLRNYQAVYANGDIKTFAAQTLDDAVVIAREVGGRFINSRLDWCRWIRETKEKNDG